MNDAPPWDSVVEVVPAPGVRRSTEDLLRAAEERFWSNVARRGDDECWFWLAGTCAGYGWFYVGGGRSRKLEAYAHRVALFFHTGTWGRVARHSCDVPLCCNPRHLQWGSYKENSQDAIARRRAYVGEANSFAKLTEANVREARRLRSEGMTYKAIASRYGVAWKTIWWACNGGWSHVS